MQTVTARVIPAGYVNLQTNVASVMCIYSVVLLSTLTHPALSQIMSENELPSTSGETVLVQPAALGGRLIAHDPGFWQLTLQGVGNTSTKFFGARDKFLTDASQTETNDSHEKFTLTKRDFAAARFAVLFAGDENMGLNATAPLSKSSSSFISLELIDTLTRAGEEYSETTTYLVKVMEPSFIHGVAGSATEGTILADRTELTFARAVLIVDMVSMADQEKGHRSLRSDAAAIADSYVRNVLKQRNKDEEVSAQGFIFYPLSLWCCPACFIGCPFEIFIPALWGMVAFKTICCIF